MNSGGAPTRRLVRRAATTVVLAAALASVPPAASAPAHCAQDFQLEPISLDANLTSLRDVSDNGTCSGGIRVAANGPDGSLWGVDWGNRLWRTTDDMAHWQLMYTAAGYTNLEQVLQLQSGYVLIVVRDSNGIRHILRSTDTTGTSFSSTPSLDFPSDAWLMADQSWVQMDGAVYAGEYGYGSTATRHLWKSTDDGLTFAPVFSIAGIRHFHNVQADPYSSGKLWVTIGDGRAQARIGYSTDGGASFTWVSQDVYPQSRAVGLMFTPNAVYWGTDTPEVAAGLFRYDRSSGAVTQILRGLNGSFRLSVSRGPVLATFSAVENATTDGYIGDQWIHTLSSSDPIDDATQWTSERTPWMRSQVSTDSKAIPVGISAPDRYGRFWLAITNLDGAPDEIGSFEIQLVDHPTFPLTNASPPAVSGDPLQGQVLYASGDAWSPQLPVGRTYQWLRCDSSGAACAPITGAASDRYRLSAADVGSTIEVRVEASNTTGAAAATTAPSAVVSPGPPYPLARPTISGTPQDGRLLYSTTGAWIGTQPWTYGYQWQRCDTRGGSCQAIAGATADRYRNTSADVGSTIEDLLTAANAYGHTSIASAPSPPIQGAPPVNLSAPTIAGFAAVASTLWPVTRGAWFGTTPFAWSYQWQRCSSLGAGCQPIPGATDYAYRVSYADVGSTIALALTATSAWGSAAATSASTGIILPAD